MEFLLTRQAQQREENLLSAYWLARDQRARFTTTHYRLDLHDHYEREGCPSPDVALLAALLLDPVQVKKAADLVTPEMFQHEADARLYAAMLYTPVTGTLADWWCMLARVATLPLSDVLNYMQYKYFNIAYIVTYAAAIRRAYIQDRAFEIARRMIERLHNEDDARAVGDAVAQLTELPVQTTPRRWTAHNNNCHT